MKLDAIQFNTSTTNTPSWTKLVDLIYPTNSIYLTRGTNAPGNSIGGNWTAITTGSVLALTGSNGFANVGKNGGNLKISVNQMPSHNHKASNDNWSHFVRTSPNSTITRTAGTIPSGSGGHYITSTTAFNGDTTTTMSSGGGRIICLIITPSKDTTETPSKCGDVEWL